MVSRDGYEIVIPTRDSASWIELFAKYYARIGIRPTYLLDGRSVDNTFDVLKRLGANVIVVESTVDRVEGMLSITKDLVQTDWVVRFDDDEMPSADLIAWLDHSLADVREPQVALSRRDALLRGTILVYSRLEDYYFHQDPTYLDPQWRAFRPREVDFVTTLHSPGFEVKQHHTAPQSAFFVHFDWMLRSFGRRIDKLRRYDFQSAGGGWGLAHYYLPELHSDQNMRWTPFETTEFVELASAIVRINVESA